MCNLVRTPLIVWPCCSSSFKRKRHVGWHQVWRDSELWDKLDKFLVEKLTKYSRKMQLRNICRRKIQMRNIVFEIQLRNVFEKYFWEIQLNRFSAVGQIGQILGGTIDKCCLGERRRSMKDNRLARVQQGGGLHYHTGVIATSIWIATRFGIFGRMILALSPFLFEMTHCTWTRR